MNLPTDYILGLILTVGADAHHCMPSLKVEDGEPVKYPEIAYAIAATCDALCKEITSIEMGAFSRDSRELVVDIVSDTFKCLAAHAEHDQELDLDSIPTILRDLRVGEIEMSEDD